MKQFTTIFLSLFLFSGLLGQVGINTTAPNAMLDIRSSNQATPASTDGILLPVIDEFPAANPGANQDGMLVFVSGNGTPSRGLYFWNNGTTSWVQFAPKAVIWDITGNSGTDGGVTNFIGTTDAQPVMIRTNNINRLRVSTTGVLENLNTNQSVYIGENSSPVASGLGNVNIGYNTGNVLTTGQYNVLIGQETGRFLTTQSNNTFVGSYVGYDTTTGTNNTLLGSGAGASVSTGSNNTYVGLSTAQRSNTGGNNAALGRSAGLFNYGGANNVYLGMGAGEGNFDPGEALTYSNNTLIGYNAGGNIAGSNNVFIGYQAGISEGGSNRLYIENSNSATPLIGGDFANNRVGINRSIGALTNTLEVGGNASKTAAGAWLANSDRRLKTNINAIGGLSALDLISKMRGVSFEWNDQVTGIHRPQGKQIGFIAQELMEIFPEKVTKDRLGYYQTAYGDYDPIFVEAIKALASKLEQTEVELGNYKARLARLEALFEDQ